MRLRHCYGQSELELVMITQAVKTINRKLAKGEEIFLVNVNSYR